MAEQKKSLLFGAQQEVAVEFDPKDPTTWWLAVNAKKGQWLEIAAQMHDHTMFVAGVPATKFYYDAKVNVEAGAAVSAWYGFDSPAIGLDAYNYEAEAMGAKMIYSANAMPTIDFREPLVAEKKDLAKLKPAANWLTAKRIPFALENLRLGAKMGTLRGMFCAPFSLAVGVRSYPLLIRDLRKDPAFAHELFGRLVDDVLPSYLKVQRETCGVDMAIGADAWSAFPNLSPGLMEEWVVPYAMKLLQNCMPLGLTAVTAGSGDYCEERLEKFDKEILFKCFDIQVKMNFGQPVIFLGMGRWHEYPLAVVAEYLAPYKEKGVRAIITAGINARLLRDGPVEAIVDNIKRYIDILGRDHNLSLFLSSIPADTNPAHIHAAVAAAHTYGALPLADNLDDVKFEIPKRESFQEFVAQQSQGYGLSF